MGELVSVNMIFVRMYSNFINSKVLTLLAGMRQEASPEVIHQMSRLDGLQQSVVGSMLHLVTDKEEVLREYDKLTQLTIMAVKASGMNPDDNATVVTMVEGRNSLVDLLQNKEVSH